jgi:hypothetical protein
MDGQLNREKAIDFLTGAKSSIFRRTDLGFYKDIILQAKASIAYQLKMMIVEL